MKHWEIGGPRDNASALRTAAARLDMTRQAAAIQRAQEIAALKQLDYQAACDEAYGPSTPESGIAADALLAAAKARISAMQAARPQAAVPSDSQPVEAMLDDCTDEAGEFVDTEGALATADDALDRSLGKVFDPGELEERLHDIIGNEGES